LRLPYFLALKAEALHLANRSAEALMAISEAEAMVERSEGRWWSAELHRIRGIILAAIGADDNQVQAAFCAAISIAREQKSTSLQKRAETTRAEYLFKK
jgi:predicted ATPase